VRTIAGIVVGLGASLAAAGLLRALLAGVGPTDALSFVGGAAGPWDFSEAQAERMRPLIRRLTYVEIGGSDHMVYVDNPSEFDPAFDAWLEAV